LGLRFSAAVDRPSLEVPHSVRRFGSRLEKRILPQRDDRRVESHCDKSSLIDDIAGTRSQTTLIETRIGTDNSAPGTPQIQVQKIRETKITTGLRVNRRPSNCGVMRFDSRMWRSKYHAGGMIACSQLSKVSRPTT